MTREEAEEQAKKVSKDESCIQHVNYNVKHGTYKVSDWFSSDSTVSTYDCGNKWD